MEDNNNKYKKYEQELKWQQQREIDRCQKYGEACSFGICDECPVTLGIQSEENKEGSEAENEQ